MPCCLATQAPWWPALELTNGFLILAGGVGKHPAILRTYSWIYAKGSFLADLRGPYAWPGIIPFGYWQSNPLFYSSSPTNVLFSCLTVTEIYMHECISKRRSECIN